MTQSKTNSVDYFIVDFDRTLADSDKLLEVFMEVADTYFQIPKAQIAQVDMELKQRGDTLFLATYVRDHLSEQNRLEEWEALEKKFIHESRALNYLLPGAAELLEWLAAHGKHYGILTYGDPLWQRLKLTASGFNHVRRIIMEQKQKGKLISNWQLPDGTFRMPHELGRGIVDRIIMIDDKAVSFEQFPPEPSRGYWVLDPDHELLSQQGSVPANVSRHTDLHSVREALSQLQ